MGRERRLNIENGYFHVISKSVEETNLYNDDEDYEKFLKILNEERLKHNISIFAFCLMPNHYHILLKTNNSNLSYFMKYLNHRYSLYFNNKNFRLGHLFMDRFKSFYINSDGYFLNVSRYIHLNPLEANLIDKPQNYNWSSYKFYYYDIENSLIDKNSFYEIISLKKEDYIYYVNNLYESLISSGSEINHINSINGNPLRISEVIKNLEKAFSNIDKKIFRNLIIFYLLNKNFNVDDIADYFDISKTHLYRIANKIESEMRKNPNIVKFYNEIEKLAPLYEE
ncbi:MAG: transposase [Caldisericia bacterium]|jgi:REP element-mobilizing transposase RayT|nr:transposase [Caldisericia bacterium]